MKSIKKILFVSLSFEWTTCERTLIRDIKIARANNLDVSCLCSRDSFIDQELKRIGIPVFYNSAKLASGIFFWRSIPKIKTYIKKYKFDLVHCFDINVLHAICFKLKNLKTIPIIFTHTREIFKSYKTILLRPLRSRIDQIIIQSDEHVENIWDKLGVHPRKIEVCGPGLESIHKIDLEQRKSFLTKYNPLKKSFIVGAYLNPDLKDTSELSALMHALQAIKSDLDFSSKVKLVLFSPIALSTFVLYPELLRFVKDNGLEHNVYFDDSGPIDEVQGIVDVWIGYSANEILEDYLLTAMLSKTPVLMPRTSASKEILRRFGHLGETYFIGDSRNLRDRLLRILRSIDEYRGSLEKAHTFVNAFYGSSQYGPKLQAIYKNTLRKRIRAFGPANKSN